jgi:hypothetical protein
LLIFFNKRLGRR